MLENLNQGRNVCFLVLLCRADVYRHSSAAILLWNQLPIAVSYERTLIKVLVLAPDPKNAGFIAYRASAQTGARTRTPIACEASSHFGTRTREMLLTKLVLISAAGRLEGECSVWASTQTGARTRDRSLLVQIFTSEFEPSLIGRKQGKCSDRDSIPGSIAYRDSAQIGAPYYAYTENALGEKHSRFHAYFYSCYTYAASVYQAMGDNWRLIMARGLTHNPKKLGFSENLGSLKT
ncbi:hypothetical protein DPMN_160651 [Dreissena polymorpha]|uniref:Uncharacterized protein n=1 Tax=Dreissena polymorpha TaxID=45954 RepID=A0A9D4ERM7_DREPO|nr:hypothetical protein DPMN_160651 [Dreissena polymorpha]